MGWVVVPGTRVFLEYTRTRQEHARQWNTEKASTFAVEGCTRRAEFRLPDQELT
jgi:hypothetical protein